MARQTLRDQWLSLYKTQLPALASQRSPVQHRWPVHLDHCFARIILDNAVGVDRPWPAVIKAPAIASMSTAQVQAAIDLGNAIAEGRADLVALDERSLKLRGKARKEVRDGKRKIGAAAGRAGRQGARQTQSRDDELGVAKKPKGAHQPDIRAHFPPSTSASAVPTAPAITPQPPTPPHHRPEDLMPAHTLD